MAISIGGRRTMDGQSLVTAAARQSLCMRRSGRLVMECRTRASIDSREAGRLHCGRFARSERAGEFPLLFFFRSCLTMSNPLEVLVVNNDEVVLEKLAATLRGRVRLDPDRDAVHL